LQRRENDPYKIPALLIREGVKLRDGQIYVLTHSPSHPLTNSRYSR
jgi:hypothetical protein